MPKTVVCTSSASAAAQLASCQSGDTFQIASGVTVANLKSVGVYWQTQTNATGITVSGCTIDGTGTSSNQQQGALFFLAPGTSITITGCTLTNAPNTAIYGYPGTGVSVTGNTVNNTAGDGIHLASSAGNNTTVSKNVITQCHRYGVELQLSGQNIQVLDNYASVIEPPESSSWGAYSIACGNSTGVVITGNTGVNDRAGAGMCIEIITDAPVTINNNLSWNFSCFILNGVTGSSINANGNTVYGGVLMDRDDAGNYPPIVGTNTVLPLSAMPNPPQPPGPTPPIPPIPPDPPQPPITGEVMFATATTTTITLNFPPSQAAGACTATIAGNGQSIPSVSVPAGVQSVTFTGLSPSWEYVFKLTQGIVSQPPLTAQCLATAGAPASPNGTPATPPAPIAPPTSAKLTITVPVSSPDCKTWTAGTATVVSQ